MNKHYDIAVIGGGAAGLFFTALASKSKKLNIALVEKNQRVGKKLAVTGNGRCNLTNIYTHQSNYHGSFSEYTKQILTTCPPEMIISIFNEMGLITRSDEAGRVYPKSNQASTVLDVLRYNCNKPNVSSFCEEKVIEIKKDKDIFFILTDKQKFTAETVVFATGGAAAPKAGGDKSGYEILRTLGHTIVKLSPALCPINVRSEHLKSLKGIRVQGDISLINNGNEISSEQGEIQFSDNALSGICVFNLSGYIEKNSNYLLRLKLLPEFTFNEINDLLKNNRRNFAALEAEKILTGITQKRIAQVLLKTAKIKLNKSVDDITDSEIKYLARLINSLDFEVSGLGDFSNAQVTKGGVKGTEVDPKTMESKKTKGLYILGEALDCNGDCGGYNLQFAFATAYIASKNYD